MHICPGEIKFKEKYQDGLTHVCMCVETWIFIFSLKYFIQSTIITSEYKILYIAVP